jgi:hypothetical protein
MMNAVVHLTCIVSGHNMHEHECSAIETEAETVKVALLAPHKHFACSI